MKPVEGPLLLFTLMLSAVTLSGCGDKNEREFIRGCKSGGGTTAVCGCIRDDLKTKYTHGELEKMNQQYGYVPPRFMDNMLSTAQQCRK
ncbi:hypothetical protein VC636_24635 [Citrobacter freundii]|uniref:hypothetical protein n=1 Tax=Citrobacter freundii TaxID=546 RepID=UPI00292C8E30|nr:hypothetical protein [Citrobacter freundii]MDV0678119.1 hypothetical protein [Citrobacter freundii]MDV0859894.1 hypothetical protein [Citrobacter freundii]MEB0577652.1 hypothetical protein [Citrobacter freundii]MEB0713382.1 hypothetical protein [Citrobacter freundii]